MWYQVYKLDKAKGNLLNKAVSVTISLKYLKWITKKFE
jgi:hypothetical protein